MADFDHFFSSDWGASGGKASDGGGGNAPYPPLMPPLFGLPTEDIALDYTYYRAELILCTPVRQAFSYGIQLDRGGGALTYGSDG